MFTEDRVLVFLSKRYDVLLKHQPNHIIINELIYRISVNIESISIRIFFLCHRLRLLNYVHKKND